LFLNFSLFVFRSLTFELVILRLS